MGKVIGSDQVLDIVETLLKAQLHAIEGLRSAF
ncbi:MAG: hypothetical protein DDT20_01624 [Firmicutes bacterium]|nr:hypothetical protein [Bacillota bacterium]